MWFRREGLQGGGSVWPGGVNFALPLDEKQLQHEYQTKMIFEATKSTKNTKDWLRSLHLPPDEKRITKAKQKPHECLQHCKSPKTNEIRMQPDKRLQTKFTPIVTKSANAYQIRWSADLISWHFPVSTSFSFLKTLKSDFRSKVIFGIMILQGRACRHTHGPE